MMILLVEDDEDTRAVTAIVLEDAGYDVVEANDGGQALTVLQANPSVALVFSDIQMPGMNGIELANILGATNHGLPVVLTSGHRADQYSNFPTGTPLLIKPYNRQGLLDVIARHLPESVSRCSATPVQSIRLDRNK